MISLLHLITFRTLLECNTEKENLRQILKIVKHDYQVKFCKLPIFFLSLVQQREETSYN